MHCPYNLTRVVCALDKLLHEQNYKLAWDCRGGGAGTRIVHQTSCTPPCVFARLLLQVYMPVRYNCLCSDGVHHSFQLCSSADGTEAPDSVGLTIGLWCACLSLLYLKLTAQKGA
jgi:hypothetical protein